MEWTTGKSSQFSYDGNKFLSVCNGLEDSKCRLPDLGDPDQAAPTPVLPVAPECPSLLGFAGDLGASGQQGQL